MKKTNCHCFKISYIIIIFALLATLIFLISFTKHTTTNNTTLKNNVYPHVAPSFPENIDSVLIPLKRAGRLSLIEVTIDNQTGNLVFDTGATGLVLNSTYFRNYVKSDSKTSNGITGAISQIDKITVDKLEIGDLQYKRISADLINLGHLENRRGVKILGLLSLELINDFEIVIDIPNNQLCLYRINKKGNRFNFENSFFLADYHQKISLLNG